LVKQELVIPSRAVLIASDASDTAVAAVRIECGMHITHELHDRPCGQKMFVRPFSTTERELSSAGRELSALFDLYVKRGHEFEGRAVWHLTDNKSVEAIMAKGSPRDYLQVVALQIYRECRKKSIQLTVVWKPRSDPRLVLADDWSKSIDYDDWSVQESALDGLELRLGGRMKWDLFASDSNHRRADFFSLLASEKARGRNALAQDWGMLGFVFACPPPGLVGPVLRHIVGWEALGGAIFPLWVSSKAWTLICKDGRHCNRMFTSMAIIHPWLSKGKDVTSNVFCGQTKFPFLSLTFNGAVVGPFES
jgi:hypothetical protein